MTVAEGTRSDAAALVYSGETYNFRDLRERLALAGDRFITRSDTEVVLNAHRQWGGATRGTRTGSSTACSPTRSGTP